MLADAAGAEGDVTATSPPPRLGLGVSGWGLPACGCSAPEQSGTSASTSVFNTAWETHSEGREEGKEEAVKWEGGN